VKILSEYTVLADKVTKHAQMLAGFWGESHQFSNKCWWKRNTPPY